MYEKWVPVPSDPYMYNKSLYRWRYRHGCTKISHVWQEIEKNPEIISTDFVHCDLYSLFQLLSEIKGDW